MAPQLDQEALALLRLLLEVLRHADPSDPKTFITYSEAHVRLGLKIQFQNAGRSLQQQGLNSLAEWAKAQGVPAITGLIVREVERDPGPGYFKFYGKREIEDLPWWIDEIRRAKQFDWDTYLPEEPIGTSPLVPLAEESAAVAIEDKTASGAEEELLSEARRIANLIFARVAISGTTQERTAPERTAPDNLVINVRELLRARPLVCYLCGGLMQIKSQNRLLQPSPDRIDSSIGDYGPQNLRLAHLACNLGKNASSVAEFQQWLEVLKHP